MANEKHLSIFRKGVAEWNEWRDKNPHITPQLSNLVIYHSTVALHGRDFYDGFLSSEDIKEAIADREDGSIAYKSYYSYLWFHKNLNGINLRQANLSNAELIKVDLTNADLSDADLRGAVLTESIFNNVNVQKTNFDLATIGNTSFININLTEAKSLSTCKHRYKSILDAASIHKSKELPESFILGCGLQRIDVLKTQLTAPGLSDAETSILAKEIQLLADQSKKYSSCFISYSTKDEEFATKLHSDLIRKGIQCWFAPHDIQGGKKIYGQILDAISQYDRTLLILSEHSMQSNWVRTEIDNARIKEQNHKRQVLFPIRLVAYDTIENWKAFDADIGKDVAKEVREYFIPDFSQWRVEDEYKSALQRLLKDLGVEND